MNVYEIFLQVVLITTYLTLLFKFTVARSKRVRRKQGQSAFLWVLATLPVYMILFLWALTEFPELDGPLYCYTIVSLIWHMVVLIGPLYWAEGEITPKIYKSLTDFHTKRIRDKFIPFIVFFTVIVISPFLRMIKFGYEKYGLGFVFKMHLLPLSQKYPTVSVSHQVIYYVLTIVIFPIIEELVLRHYFLAEMYVEFLKGIHSIEASRAYRLSLLLNTILGVLIHCPKMLFVPDILMITEPNLITNLASYLITLAAMNLLLGMLYLDDDIGYDIKYPILAHILHNFVAHLTL